MTVQNEIGPGGATNTVTPGLTDWKESAVNDAICSIEGCESTYRIKRGMCNAHYCRWRRHGDPLAGGTSPDPDRGCSVPNCESPHHSAGMCMVHARRVERTGSPYLSGLAAKDERDGSTEGRFWNRVERANGCWKWTGHIDAKGYARFKADGSDRFAHRYSYELHHGPIAEGMDIDHKCRNRSCVNPDHLHAVSHWENMQNLASRNPRSTSGYRGVSIHKKSGKWKAEVRSRGKIHYLGLYETPEAAAEMARQKRNELFTNNQEDRRAHVHG